MHLYERDIKGPMIQRVGAVCPFHKKMKSWFTQRFPDPVKKPVL